jgi:predicted DNA binding CopG/RHH family protein
MKSPHKSVAKIKSEADERAYWEREDSGADLDWRLAERARLPNLKPSTWAISLRLPVTFLEEIKIAAHKRDVPYQSLIKMWLAEKVG